jgi:hypothetical protein
MLASIPKQVEELALLEASASDLMILFAAHIVIWARKEATKMKMLAMRKTNSSACFGIH